MSYHEGVSGTSSRRAPPWPTQGWCDQADGALCARDGCTMMAPSTQQALVSPHTKTRAAQERHRTRGHTRNARYAANTMSERLELRPREEGRLHRAAIRGGPQRFLTSHEILGFRWSWMEFPGIICVDDLRTDVRDQGECLAETLKPPCQAYSFLSASQTQGNAPRSCLVSKVAAPTCAAGRGEDAVDPHQGTGRGELRWKGAITQTRIYILVAYIDAS